MPTTELHWACISGDQQRAQHILLKCNDLRGTLKSKQDDGRTGLHLACYHGHAGIADILIKSGSDINVLDKSKCLPIHLCCRQGHSKVLTVLIKHGCDPGVKDKLFGDNCLHKACAGGHIDTVKELLDAGIDHLSMTNGGEYPWEVAKFYKHDELAQFLRLHDVLVRLGTNDTKAARRIQRWVRKNKWHIPDNNEQFGLISHENAKNIESDSLTSKEDKKCNQPEESKKCKSNEEIYPSFMKK